MFQQLLNFPAKGRAKNFTIYKMEITYFKS